MRVSENPLIGVLPPGPISNYDLFVKTKENIHQIKQNLEINEHYRGVNKEVWEMFYKLYGGGPIIIREALDIYSKDL